jgi:hypothetical protein
VGCGGLRAENSIVLNRNRPHNSNGVGVRWREVEVKGGVGLRATRRGALTRGCTGADADAGLVLVVLLLLLVVRRSSCSTGAGVGSQCLYYSLTSAGCGGEEDESQQQDRGDEDACSTAWASALLVFRDKGETPKSDPCGCIRRERQRRVHYASPHAIKLPSNIRQRIIAIRASFATSGAAPSTPSLTECCYAARLPASCCGVLRTASSPPPCLSRAHWSQSRSHEDVWG